jgi:hypothetical protein
LLKQNYSRGFSRIKQSRKDYKSQEFMTGLLVSTYLFRSCSECLLAIIPSQVDESSFLLLRTGNHFLSLSPGTGPAL